MDSSSIELPGSTIKELRVEGDTVRICFSPAVIIKTMTGSVERTKWQQSGELVFEGAELEGDPPGLPAVCVGGDVGENVYTYRDMIPIPLRSRGRAHCVFAVAGDDRKLRVRADGVHLELEAAPTYVEHLRPA
jgi:hypothetical protein